MKKIATILLFAAALSPLRAQIAGISTLSVLDMPGSVRSAGIGFDFISIFDNDVTLTLNNPSLIAERHNNQCAVSFMNLFAGSNFGSVAFSHSFKQLGSFTFGLTFDSYGRFEGYDENDYPMGSFSAADYVLSIGWGRAISDNVTIGANFKPVFSHYEDYTALAFGIDLAATYFSPNRAFAATLIGRNIGAQVVTLSGTRETLPFELSIAGSYKLQDAPFRFFFALNELQRWNLAYSDPINPSEFTDPFTGEVTRPTFAATFADQLFRHINAGIELSIKNAFFARIGYSYRQMAEMTAADLLNLSGFSFGFGIHTKKYEFCFSRNNYHLSQAPNFISLSFKI